MDNYESLDKILQEDLENISKNFEYSKLKNSNILITGATGLIGNQIVLELLYLNRVHNLSINVYAVGRNLERLKQKFSKVLNRKELHLIQGDVIDGITCEDNIDYIIHGASFTQSKSFVEKPVDTILTAVDGSKNMLKFAKDKNVKGFVYLSSMEVFGFSDSDKKLKEEDYGYIDILNLRSSYSESKRMVECLCKSFAKQYDMPIKIARLAQTVGPGFKYEDNRMVVQFAKAIIEKNDIELLTDGSSKFCPIYTSDEIAGIFTVLLYGISGEAYTIANSSAYSSVKDLAEMIAKNLANNEIKVVFRKCDTSKFPKSSKLNLDTSKLENLGWSAKVSLEQMYARLSESLKFSRK